MPSQRTHSSVVNAEGHLVDSQILTAILDTIIERGAEFEVLAFHLGRTNTEFSRLSIRVSAETPEALTGLLEALIPLGCHAPVEEDAILRVADRDRCAPEDFYSTTNLRTEVRLDGRWTPVDRQRMDAVITAGADGGLVCTKLRDVRAGDRIVCGVAGIRVQPEFRDRDRSDFTFMSNEVSSERRVELSVDRIAAMMRDMRQRNRRIAFVAGPVVIHTGGSRYFCELIRLGYVQLLLAGNALAVHDAELALFGTSLGIDAEKGDPVHGGHRHHMRAINAVNRAGGIRGAVESGLLTSGVMHECVRHGVEFLLAGSIRDDGPLADTVTDMSVAQDLHAAALHDIGMVIVLSSMLHGIGVGNMLPSWVPLVCVDINPAVVTKLADRGSSQTIGLVTDVGLFLHQLAATLAAAP